MLEPGGRMELAIDKAVAGGRMLARHDGQVVLVSGAIPGERVVARVDVAGRRMAYATAVDIVEPSADRRPVEGDPTCGGSVFAHIAYERQLRLKEEILADAFARIARLALPGTVRVEGSPEQGYRMRARLHVREGSIGFFREGSHDLCDATRTGQLGAAAATVVRALGQTLRSARLTGIESIELSENVAADERVLHVALLTGAPAPARALLPLARVRGLRGISCSRSAHGSGLVVHGSPYVADPLARLLPDRSLRGDLQLRRHARSFFQANRFLLPTMVSRVADLVPDGPVVDLYAGVGLFGIALAALGRSGITCVEVERAAGHDLEANAGAAGGAVRAERSTAEDYLARTAPGARTIVVDPPRTGLSRKVVSGLLAHQPSRVVYVSCDPPTLARDARLLIAGGYGLEALEAFDFFPNTAHVETVAVFEKQ